MNKHKHEQLFKYFIYFAKGLKFDINAVTKLYTLYQFQLFNNLFKHII